MATEIRMPQFGVSMETGTVAQWLKAEGDTVKAGDVLASIETEKLTNDVPKAKRSDPKLEAEMLAVARTVYDDGRVALKALIQSPDWAYDRTALGQIINRNQSAYIIYRMPNGKHRAIELGFKQMYNGSSYGKTQLRGIGTRDFEVDYK